VVVPVGPNGTGKTTLPNVRDRGVFGALIRRTLPAMAATLVTLDRPGHRDRPDAVLRRKTYLTERTVVHRPVHGWH